MERVGVTPSVKKLDLDDGPTDRQSQRLRMTIHGRSQRPIDHVLRSRDLSRGHYVISNRLFVVAMGFPRTFLENRSIRNFVE